MASPDPDPSRLAIGSKPVNRRTRRLQPSDSAERPEVVQQRQQQLRARHELGRPLAAGPRPVAAMPLPVAARVQAGLGVASLSGALFVSQPVLVGVLVVIGSAGLGWAVRGVWRQRRGPGDAVSPALLAPEALDALDGLLVRAVPALPAPATVALKAVKQALDLAQQPGALARLALQDALFVQQSVARYLPDSLEAYLRVPADRRGQPLSAGQPSADEALATQLTTLLEGLQRRLRPLQDEAGEALLRQQRFLEAKARE